MEFNGSRRCRLGLSPELVFRISKYTLPFIKSKYVPETLFLNEIKSIPEDLENWVLKPLFSFAGHGVIFNVTKEDVERYCHMPRHLFYRKK